MEKFPPEVELDISNTEKLVSKFKGFLWNIRQWELKQIDSLIRAVRSSSIENIT